METESILAHQTPPSPHFDANINATIAGDTLRLSIKGHLDAPGTTHVWDPAVATIRQGGFRHAEADCSRIEYMDGAGVALLLKLREEAHHSGASFELHNLRDDYKQLVELTWDRDYPDWEDQTKDRRGLTEALGAATGEVLNGIREMIAFTGEATAIICKTIRHPSKVRWKDVLLSCLAVGVDSLFIIVLIGFLMGLIMSFQSAITLQRFGGEIFVPNMLGLVMFREMGPLVTAILLAARSGSAFAAEIGTMKINEELDALTTMGLSPMRFLVVPKLLSSLTMVPLMIIFFNFASLIGGAVVMLSMGFPLVTFTSRVFTYLSFAGFFSGMLKGLVFAVLVAGVGCLRGMQTRSGASAVGMSTTSAVVSGIVMIAFADGIFAVIYYYLGI